MPFSFKPEISQTGADPAVQPAPQASFGDTSTANLMTRASEEGKSLLHIALLFVFLITALVTAGLFAYKYYLSSQIEGKKATLASYESRLATLPLEDMRKLSNRIKVVNQLIKEHPSVNVAFRIVEDSVENQVIYKSFELRYNEQTKSYALQLGGTAPDYKSVAQQMDTFKRKPYTTYVPSVTVEGLQPDESGRVAFTLKMPISIAGLLPEGLNLSDGAAARAASSTIPSVATTTAATTTATGTPSGVQTGTTTPPRAATTTPR